MARTDPQINFRLPKQLKDKIEQSAKDNGRSVTQEVIAAIEQGYARQNEPVQTTDLLKAIADLKAEIQSLKEKPTA